MTRDWKTCAPVYTVKVNCTLPIAPWEISHSSAEKPFHGNKFGLNLVVNMSFNYRYIQSLTEPNTRSVSLCFLLARRNLTSLNEYTRTDFR